MCTRLDEWIIVHVCVCVGWDTGNMGCVCVWRGGTAGVCGGEGCASVHMRQASVSVCCGGGGLSEKKKIE
jgi:hypothetical protein